MTAEAEKIETTPARLIKRYANRKLYDTRESSYVTLQQIAVMVREGQEVKIVDNLTKLDITRVTLAQIIYEEEKSGFGAGTSIKNLRSMIQDGADRLMSSLHVSKVVKFSPKEALDELQKLADERVKTLLNGAANQVSKLEAEVGRLQKRIEELEGRLRQPESKSRSRSRSGSGDSEPDAE